MSAAQIEFDSAVAARFAERAGEIINTGAVAVMMSIGHRTGLFETLSRLPASTSAEIAARAGLAERYVREWLAVMAMAGIVRYDAARGTYQLPAEHAACLTRDGALGNLAVYAQHIALMGNVQDLIVERFASGAGTRYDDYPHMHDVMEEDSAQTVTAQLFSRILPLAPELPERLQAGIDVLDAGCGRGLALLVLAQRYPHSRFTGYDLCADAIEHARQLATSAGLNNLRFEQRDLTQWEQRKAYDLITTFDAVHDQRDPQDFLRRLHAALRPHGVYLMQDIGGSARLENNFEFPFAALLYAISCVHCTPISMGQGGPGLGTMWGWETALAMLEQAGFASPERHLLPNDPMNVWFVARK